MQYSDDFGYAFTTRHDFEKWISITTVFDSEILFTVISIWTTSESPLIIKIEAFGDVYNVNKLDHIGRIQAESYQVKWLTNYKFCQSL